MQEARMLILFRLARNDSVEGVSQGETRDLKKALSALKNYGTAGRGVAGSALMVRLAEVRPSALAVSWMGPAEVVD